MAKTEAVRAVQAIYQHVDDHVRELLPPPLGPEVDTALMVLQGAGSSAGTGGSTGTGGPGACSPVALFGGSASANFSAGFVFVARSVAPTGWTTANVIRRRTDATAGNCYVRMEWEDATMTPIASGAYADQDRVLAAGGTHTIPAFDLVNQPNRDLVKYVSLWVRAQGVAPQDSTTYYPFTVSLEATFTGTCIVDMSPASPSVGLISPGVVGVWSFDYRARITGWYLQDVEGASGSIALALAKAPRGPTPTFVNIAGSAPPAISGGRYAEDATLVGWDDFIDRGDVIRVSVTSVSTFTRLLFGLRIRRLEP